MTNLQTFIEKSYHLLNKTVLTNPYIPHKPTPRQAVFLTIPVMEALYGGAAGGGKSDALLMAALQYVHLIPGYSSILFRRTFQDLGLPEALMERAAEWLSPTNAQWNGNDKKWRFPNGSTLNFGYLDTERHKYRYQSAAFQFVGFDELTQFMETQYRYLFSRLRRTKGMGTQVPLRMRSGSNPGGIGHEWVLTRFMPELIPQNEQGENEKTITHDKGKRVFVPSRLEDNPHLDEESYTEALEELDEITRKQLQTGDWSVRPEGTMFKRMWFAGKVVEAAPPYMRLVRFWDLASTAEPKGKEGQAKTDPDWTVGALVGEFEGSYFILDVRRFRKSPAETEKEILATAESDGRGITIYMEEEGGSSGKISIDHYARNVLKGYAFYGERAEASKVVRAKPFSSAAQRGLVYLYRGNWIRLFIDELESFPQKGFHDDQVDAVSGAIAKLAEGKSRVLQGWS